MFALLSAHVAVGVAIVAAGDRLGRRAVALAVVPPAAAVLWVVVHLAGVIDGEPFVEQVSWVPQLGLQVRFMLDAMAALMVLVVSGVGVLVLVYAARDLPRAGQGVGRLVGLLVLFAGAMLAVVLADNLLVLYVGWELTSVVSYLLIGNRDTEVRARAAALHALLVTSLGGLAMLVGFVVIGQAAGTFQLSAVLSTPPRGTAVSVALVLVLIGAAAKSAQYPLHSWLPRAMVAPTPVSAYLHSAAMVKAGIYVVARFAPAFATVPLWRPTVVAVSGVTMLAGGLRALRQHDLKLLLAYGTISQLGLLFLLFGLGTPAATAAGVTLLVAHVAFKAALFMVVGIIDHQTGSRDMRALHGLAQGWRGLTLVAVTSAASMAAVPLTVGFVAKEAALEALADGGVTGSGGILVAIVVGAAVTTAYSLRFLWGALTAGATDWTGAPPAAPVEHSPPASFVAPAAVLALLTLVLGVVPGVANPLVGAATRALDATADPPPLALWHGLTLALGLSIVALLAGVGLFLARRPVARVLALGARLPSGNDVYLASLRGLNGLADGVTAGVQTGSLPFYAGVTLLTAALGPGVVLVVSGAWSGWPPLVDTAAHLPVAAVLVGGALGAATARRRLVAVVFLSVTGYGMAALFVVQGAPDLALTQVAIETLSTVLFVLVLRRLPSRFRRRPSVGRPLRLAVAGVVGAVVFFFALVAGQTDPQPSVSAEGVRRALPDGEGRNVVNVILVDFRGFDTMGEITVLAVAAVGAVALARAGRRRRTPIAAEVAATSTMPADDMVAPS